MTITFYGGTKSVTGANYLLDSGGVKILVSGFYSLKDTLTPVKISFICLILNVILNIILIFPMKVGGLALASSVSSTLNFIILFFLLTKKIGTIFDKQLLGSFLKISLSSIIMATATFFSWHNLFFKFKPLFSVSGVILISVLVYLLSCLLLKVKEMRDLLGWLWKKKS